MSAISELTTIRRDRPKTPEEKRLAKREAGRDNKAGYLFLLPWLIGLIVITIGPLLASLYLSFTSTAVDRAVRKSLKTTSSSETAAIARAAHDVLAEYFPGATGTLDARLATN